MINFSNAGKEAKLRYLDGDYQVVQSGSFVTCAITGRSIALEDLKYWSVDRQEAYADATASYQAYVQAEKP
ncbi:DUF2093 domain-containing protein [Cohaesibacter gelatinilyticus]|uniref:DUF2093 domain-containing protein n=1 Tax=Cohaesibacter gelatinilyticus TaxID=372072 RepID=A0A285N8P4_9HYPH|nr:DUF2093 domain-containing protein [Cohaesibacter gelatinilyticus]SNZ05864.1 hypothetical protein SAMN06265368_0225 [Cohaesibacter gelatinilyticus]HAT86861.1 DUF2093 domain-containing protein [Hyphomicrobiales bacterium]